MACSTLSPSRGRIPCTSILAPAVPGTKKPELLLYDNNRNLVAVAAGNASDGSSCTIDFTVPANSAGTWYVEVTRANAAQDNFAYGLVIQGATGVGPLNPIDPKSDGAVKGPSVIGADRGVFGCYVKWKRGPDTIGTHLRS